MKKKLSHYKAYTPYLYIIPAMIILIIFVFYPLIQAINYSFHDYNMLTPPEWVGLENYKTLFGSKMFYKALKNTVVYFIVVVPTLVIIPVFIAILVNKQLKGTTFFRAMFYIPVVTNMVVAGIAWKWLYAETGLLNHILQNVLHVIDKPIHWLTDPKIALFSVIAVTAWKGMGYYMVIYLAGLQSISKDIYEAAEVDGAYGLRKHFSITLPLLAPHMAVVAVMSSMAAMKVFDEIFIMTGGGPFSSTKTLVFYLYEEAFGSLRMGYGATVGVVLFVILLVFSIFSIKLSENNYEA